MLFSTLKSGLMAAFFLVISATPAQAEAAHGLEISTLLAQARDRHLAFEPIWHNLLHMQQGVPQIADPQFLLSWPAFSTEAELQATLELIVSAPRTTACRFPARSLWLQTRLDLPDLGSSQCPEIREFIAKAPFDRLELVFADESVTQPASVLGHSFLNISGTRDGQEIEHAISFYTHAETINLPKLLWESLITGKEGLFALTPYAQEEKKYLEDEQRNLWRYEIRTTPAERALIRNHLFELKNSQLTYFFHRYNCATVLRNILALTGDVPPTSRWWVTPKDVVKDLQAAHRIETAQVSLADSWLATHLSPGIPDMAAIRHGLQRTPPPNDWPQPNWSKEQLAAVRAYNRWLQYQGALDDAAYAANLKTLGPATNAQEEPPLQISQESDPRQAPGQTHLRTEWSSSARGNQLRLQWIPVSHTLMQSHSHASAETEMVLLSPTVSIDKNHRLRLEEFQIFSMKSLIPWHPWLKSWSTQTQISYGTMTGHPLDPRSLYATLELGAMARHGPVDIFAVTGPGLSVQTNGQTNAVWRADVGLLWRHGTVAKSRLTWTRWEGDPHSANKLEFEQSWFWRPGWIASWKFSDVAQLASHHRSMGLSLMHTF